MTKINIEQLVMLVAIFFIIYFMINIKETFEQLSPKEKSKKECSQKAINDGYNHYIFGGVKFIR